MPPDWEHPRDDATGQYLPLYDEDFNSAAREWVANFLAWETGTHNDVEAGAGQFYWEWEGDPPERGHYREAAWTEEQATHYQVYETVSEGTPVSPVFASADEVVHWLVKQGHSVAAAQRFVKGGSAPSMVVTGGRVYVGIDALALPAATATPGGPGE